MEASLFARVWLQCVYELAWWLANKETTTIDLVNLHYNEILKKSARSPS